MKKILLIKPECLLCAKTPTCPREVGLLHIHECPSHPLSNPEHSSIASVSTHSSLFLLLSVLMTSCLFFPIFLKWNTSTLHPVQRKNQWIWSGVHLDSETQHSFEPYHGLHSPQLVNTFRESTPTYLYSIMAGSSNGNWLQLLLLLSEGQYILGKSSTEEKSIAAFRNVIQNAIQNKYKG